MRIVLGVVVLLTVLSAALTFAGRSSVDAGEGDLAVSLSDFAFDEESYEVDGGTTVVVRNDDPFLHTFTIDDLGVDEAISPGAEVLVEIPSEAGDYVLYCKPHTSEPEEPSEDDMAAEFSVR
jgi:plastocyanin